MMQDVDKVPRILIADDNPQIHTDFERSLRDDVRGSDALSALEDAVFGAAAATIDGPEPSYRIEHALQGEDAVHKVSAAVHEKDPIAVAFVDMRMPPGWDGLRTIEEIWKVDREIEVVICTAYTDYPWEAIQKRLGKSDRLLILRKPFDRIEIRQMAVSLTEKSRLNKLAKLKRQELEALLRERTRQLEACAAEGAAMPALAPVSRG